MTVASSLSALFKTQEAQRLAKITYNTSEATYKEVQFLFDMIIQLYKEVQALQTENTFLSSQVMALEDELSKRKE